MGHGNAALGLGMGHGNAALGAVGHGNAALGLSMRLGNATFEVGYGHGNAALKVRYGEQLYCIGGDVCSTIFLPKEVRKDFM